MSSPVTGPATPDATAGAAGSTQTGPSGTAPAMQQPTAATTVTDLNKLKEEAPQFYNLLTESIAQTICKEMRDSQARLKQKMRESQKQQ